MMSSRPENSPRLGIVWVIIFSVLALSPVTVRADNWRDIVLPIELTVGYAVRVVDLSKDGKPDIAIVDSKRFVWLENPTWQVHQMHGTPDAKADNVCFAPHDVDQDGDIDFAIGYDWQPNNTRDGGAVAWLESPADPRQKWTLHAVSDQEPTMHRMSWADTDGDGTQELIAVPLKGRGAVGPGWENETVHVSRWRVPAVPSDPWKKEVIESSLPVMHNFEVVDFDRDGRDDLLMASFSGVHLWTLQGPAMEKRLVHLGEGHRGTAPDLGASEIRMGQLDGQRRYIATIEPWHGNRVVVYEQSPNLTDASVVSGLTPLWPRQIIDDQLRWGHAVNCVNLDQDPEQEIVIGVRDDSDPHRFGVRIYDREPSGKWKRGLIHPGQVAVEDLTTADLDGDGLDEIIAVGRATHNAVIYTRSAP
jgi:hypothetical protein